MAYAVVNSFSRILASYAYGLDIQPITESEFDEFESLLGALQRLDDHCYRGIDRSEIKELEAKMMEEVWKLEDVLESHQISRGVDEKSIEQEIHSFFKKANKLREEYERALLESSCVRKEDIVHDADAVSRRKGDHSTTVGLSDQCQEIISELLDRKSDTHMFSIMGMAGIGKTHLARDIFNHPLIVQHFELRLWVSIGPNHKDIKKIFVDILAQIEHKPTDIFKENHEHELIDRIRKSLLFKKYLVVFDDVWSESVLIECISSLRLHCKVLVTTRILDLGETWHSKQICLMPFLSDEESWNLLRQNVFVESPFPTQLEKAGREIAHLCEGLPLLILAVADILRGLDETEECWNKVAKKKTTTFTEAYDRIYEVLLLSYDYLLQRYKACFLYMGVFRQCSEISASKLSHLWNVEGLFVDDKVLEVLKSNSIVIVCKQGLDSITKSCKLHCVYWYVCVTEARKIALFHVLIKLTDVSIERPRRLSVQNNILFGMKEVYDSMAKTTSLTRSLLFSGEYHQYPVQICFNTMILMKVLDALAIRFYEFPNEVLNLLRLRYLALTHYGEVPSSISKLQHLEFLILRRHHNIIKVMQRDSLVPYLPKEIWDLEVLEYLRIMGSNLPDPNRVVKLRNLSGLYVNADSCTANVFTCTPNVKKLRIEVELQPEGGAETLRCFEHIELLDKLESVKCVVLNPRLSSKVVAPSQHLSYMLCCLKKLSLNGLGYPWTCISGIGSMSKLEVLKLRCSAFQGPEWEIKGGKFLKLEYLLLEDMDVVHWKVDRWSLLKLRHLVVRHCYKLKTIPYSHNLLSMERIEVDECSPSVVESAQQIKYIDVVINYSWNL